MNRTSNTPPQPGVIPEPAGEAPGRRHALTTSQAKPSASRDDGSNETCVLNLPKVSMGATSLYVLYSGVSAKAQELATKLIDLAISGPRHKVPMKLDFVAYAVDLGRSDKLWPYLTELEGIGFTEIGNCVIDSDTGKRRQLRNDKGRTLPYVFTLHVEPREGYSGPRDLSDMYGQWLLDRSAAEDEALKAGRKVSSSRLVVRRSVVGRFENPQVRTVPDFRDGFAVAVPDFGDGSENPQVRTVPDFRDGSSLIDRSSISGREIEGSMEPVPGGTAKPPATGQDERLADEVARLYARLPWAAWVERRRLEGKRVQYTLNNADAQLVTAAVRSALASGKMTFEQAEKIGPAALDKVTSGSPARYVADAYAVHLDTWLSRITVVMPAEDVLPLPGLSIPQVKAHKATNDHDAGQADEPSKQVLPACGTCDAHVGEQYPSARTVTEPDGREAPCPDCAALGLCPPVA